ncbi:exoribonuclease R [Corynebacterium mustelae]|uniref:Exoribonuclease R n=1 Tax=Corynebacterium mustelae TaxID=571915 RepID=A0A0G3GZH9_9CORY|nr:RNB domain-containing ribonuclease [Corynebacterium mustelae]AKK06566.1 exoribonuclease R [Corynebacterium mustelae]
MKLYAADVDFRPIVEEFSLNGDFTDEQRAEAAAAVDHFPDDRIDATDIPFVTIDPAGSMDLDQAVHIAARPTGGFIVSYAIADVAAFVRPGSAVYAESLRRGQTLYLPDAPIRLHPPELSEDKASLLPGQTRPAALWHIELDAAGEVETSRVDRAMIRSVKRYDYEEAQQEYEAGTIHPAIQLLPQVGQLRAESNLRADAVTLNMPSQRVHRRPDGLAELRIEPRVPMMDYNSEISLLAGMCAGQIMADAGIGVLRSLALPENSAVTEFWKEVRSLGFSTHEQQLGTFLRTLDGSTPRGMAVMREAQKLLRGADYLNLSNSDPLPHAGVTGTATGVYSHVTAPLRRLADRFATEICLAITAGSNVPEWVTTDLAQVLETMTESSRLAAAVDRACLDYCEAHVLQPWIGEQFDAIIIQADPKNDAARIFIEEPPVFADCDNTTDEEGIRRPVTLTTADPATREVRFSAV